MFATTFFKVMVVWCVASIRLVFSAFPLLLRQWMSSVDMLAKKKKRKRKRAPSLQRPSSEGGNVQQESAFFRLLAGIFVQTALCLLFFAQAVLKEGVCLGSRITAALTAVTGHRGQDMAGNSSPARCCHRLGRLDGALQLRLASHGVANEIT